MSPNRPGGHAVPGLPDDAYRHDGQLTKREVRAVTLARLAPVPGELLWDVGAGAGSVAIEWARAHPECRRSPSRTGPTAPGASPPTPPPSASRTCAWSPARPPRRWPAWPPRTPSSSAAG